MCLSGFFCWCFFARVLGGFDEAQPDILINGIYRSLVCDPSVRPTYDRKAQGDTLNNMLCVYVWGYSGFWVLNGHAY